MPKFNVDATVVLFAEITPGGDFDFNSPDLGAVDFVYAEHDISGWPSEISYEVDLAICELEAEDENNARDAAQNILGQLTYSGDSIDWQVMDGEIRSIEEILTPITPESALAFLRTYLSSAGVEDAELRRVLVFVIAMLETQTAQPAGAPQAQHVTLREVGVTPRNPVTATERD